MRVTLIQTIIAFMVVVCSKADFEANISCTTCSTPCPASSCYLVSWEGYSKQVCPQISCYLYNNQTSFAVMIGSCTKDYKQDDCADQICYYPKQKTGFVQTGIRIPGFLGYQGNASIDAQCTNCSNATNCSNDTMTINISGFEASQPTQSTKYGLNLCPRQPTKLQQFSCNNSHDCYKWSGNMSGNLGFCNSYASFLNDGDLVVQAKKKIAQMSNATGNSSSLNQSKEINVNISCGPCSNTTSCQNCWTIVGDSGLQLNQFCAPNGCPLNNPSKTLNITISPCTKDYKEDPCPDKFCYRPKQSTGCLQTMFTLPEYTQNDSSVYFTASCYNCLNASICTNDTMTIEATMLLSGKYSSLWSKNVSGACPYVTTQFYNLNCIPSISPCKHCYQIFGKMSGNLGFCNSKAQFLSDANLVTKIKTIFYETKNTNTTNTTNTNTTNTNTTNTNTTNTNTTNTNTTNTNSTKTVKSLPHLSHIFALMVLFSIFAFISH